MPLASAAVTDTAVPTAPRMAPRERQIGRSKPFKNDVFFFFFLSTGGKKVYNGLYSKFQVGPFEHAYGALPTRLGRSLAHASAVILLAPVLVAVAVLFDAARLLLLRWSHTLPSAPRLATKTSLSPAAVRVVAPKLAVPMKKPVTTAVPSLRTATPRPSS